MNFVENILNLILKAKNKQFDNEFYVMSVKENLMR